VNLASWQVKLFDQATHKRALVEPQKRPVQIEHKNGWHDLLALEWAQNVD